MTFARLSAVYGLSFADICAMPLSAISAYIERIPAVLAERKLIVADGAVVPHLKNPTKAVRDWMKIAYGDRSKRRAPLGSVMIMGVQVVKVKRAD